MFIVRECRYVCGGRKGPDVFFSAKKLRNAPWEVVPAWQMTRTFFQLEWPRKPILSVDLSIFFANLSTNLVGTKILFFRGFCVPDQICWLFIYLSIFRSVDLLIWREKSTDRQIDRLECPSFSPFVDVCLSICRFFPNFVRWNGRRQIDRSTVCRHVDRSTDQILCPR